MSSTGKGYRMANKPDLLDADIIRFGLETKWLGRDLRCFQEISSTNELAKEVARNSENGTVILAMIQTRRPGQTVSTMGFASWRHLDEPDIEAKDAAFTGPSDKYGC